MRVQHVLMGLVLAPALASAGEFRQLYEPKYKGRGSSTTTRLNYEKKLASSPYVTWNEYAGPHVVSSGQPGGNSCEQEGLYKPRLVFIGTSAPSKVSVSIHYHLFTIGTEPTDVSGMPFPYSNATPSRGDPTGATTRYDIYGTRTVECDKSTGACHWRTPSGQSPAPCQYQGMTTDGYVAAIKCNIPIKFSVKSTKIGSLRAPICTAGFQGGTASVIGAQY